MSIDMVALAGRNLRSYLSKASFGSSVDRQAAINCIEVLEEAIAAKPLDETAAPLVKVAQSLDKAPLDKAVAAAPADPSTEYKRGLRAAFDCASKIKYNRQGRTAEETCAYIVRRLSEYANGFSSVLEENEGRDVPDSRSLGVIAPVPADNTKTRIRVVEEIQGVTTESRVVWIAEAIRLADAHAFAGKLEVIEPNRKALHDHLRSVPFSAAPEPIPVPAEGATSDVTELVLRDVCETDPADPNLNDTVCIDISDLKIILDRYLTAAPEPIHASDAAMDNLAALVRQLVHSLRKAKPDSPLAARAMDYLQRHDLMGSVLRDSESVNKAWDRFCDVVNEPAAAAVDAVLVHAATVINERIFGDALKWTDRGAELPAGTKLYYLPTAAKGDAS